MIATILRSFPVYWYIHSLHKKISQFAKHNTRHTFHLTHSMVRIFRFSLFIGGIIATYAVVIVEHGCNLLPLCYKQTHTHELNLTYQHTTVALRYLAVAYHALFRQHLSLALPFSCAPQLLRSAVAPQWTGVDRRIDVNWSSLRKSFSCTWSQSQHLCA